jgi:cytochrome bd-type quinol oxidase subunit 2
MIEHLSAEQISQWMMGERTPQLEEHVAECPECRSELEQLETALVQFRSAVRAAGHSASPPVWRATASHGPWFSWPRLVLAAAALLILVALPLTWRARVQERAAEAALADSQLLERVDSAVSQAVPEPMEPLVNLVTWNASPAEKNQKVQRQ